MYLHPYLGSELARAKQRDMIAQAQRLNQARQVRNLTQASRRATWAERWMLRLLNCRRPAAPAPDQSPASCEPWYVDGFPVEVELIHPGATD